MTRDPAGIFHRIQVVHRTAWLPAPIYPQLEAIALPHLVAYVTDLTRHDAAICRALEPGDVAMYAIRSNGTHFCTYSKTSDIEPDDAANTARKALDYVDAVQFVARDARWHHVECTAATIGTVQPISFSDARAIVNDEYVQRRRSLGPADRWSRWRTSHVPAHLLPAANSTIRSPASRRTLRVQKGKIHDLSPDQDHHLSHTSDR